MKKFFNILGYPFIKLWKFLNSDTADKLARYLQGLMLSALPLVELAATMAPLRTNPELIALFEKLAVAGVEKFLGLPQEDRGKALFEAVSAEMQRRYPDLPLSYIHKAVQDAVLYYKLESGQQIPEVVLK